MELLYLDLFVGAVGARISEVSKEQDLALKSGDLDKAAQLDNQILGLMESITIAQTGNFKVSNEPKH